jgi:hypothetical protein
MVVYHISCKNAMGFQNIFHRVSKKTRFFRFADNRRPILSDFWERMGSFGQ